MVKVFVNGDSHTQCVYGGSGPTATAILAAEHNCELENMALAGGSNQRIIRTTQQRLPDLDPADTLIIIGWSSFERTEWFYQDQWHQICGDSAYSINSDLRILHDQHINSWWCDDNHEVWRRHQEQHHAIWMFHNLLHDLGYKFVFYQGCRTFFFDGCPQQDQQFQLPWKAQTWMHHPYVLIDSDGNRTADSFSHHSQALGMTHADEREHYGADAHVAWADRLRPIFREKLMSLKQQGAK